MGGRLMVGLWTLTPGIGVRIPAPQPFMSQSDLNGPGKYERSEYLAAPEKLRSNFEHNFNSFGCSMRS